MKPGDTWRTHQALIDEWRAAGRLLPDPQSCAGTLRCIEHRKGRAAFLECDVCGLELTVAEPKAPEPATTTQFEPDADIPI